MRTWRQWLLLGLAVSEIGISGCQKSPEVSSQVQKPAEVVPQGSNPAASGVAPKLNDAANKTRIEMQVYQINQSKLPDAEKQRLIEQVKASSPK